MNLITGRLFVTLIDILVQNKTLRPFKGTGQRILIHL